ncbi:MAG: aminotransferase class I/II-fold pyridoxal phosphate-dependent enzyme [Actinomycetota bacterium]|nr:aminotransferase class I/II-fold pyridoxal phosphate-dependent enzyme [Actinomycetota bacterium]
MTVHAEPLETLRLRTSEKWRAYPDDVLPLFVAEMDYPLAPGISRVLHERIAASDSGYVGSPGELPAAFSDFAAERWGWRPSLGGIRTTTDVSVAIVETLRQVMRPGDGVVMTTPVYPPFRDLIEEVGGVVVDVPLLAAPDRPSGYALDLPGLEAAFAGGARAMLLCHPHNPLGLIHPAAELAAIAESAARHRVTVVSDEIHSPLVHVGESFTPFLSISDAAREWGVTVTSASKGFNLAGFKCALMIAESPRTVALLDAMSFEVGGRTSILGLHASVTGFREDVEWLDGTIAAIEESGALLGELLAAKLPGVGYRPPRAGYLAWLDFRGLGWGDDPSARILTDAKVALVTGLAFGPSGAGHARLNLACSPEVLREAIERIAALRETAA